MDKEPGEGLFAFLYDLSVFNLKLFVQEARAKAAADLHGMAKGPLAAQGQV